MPFLSGSLGFERFTVTGFKEQRFGEEHIARLQQFASGQFQTSAIENVQVGFLGGDHLFDQTFDLGKNVIDDALHCSVRVDTNQIPSAIRQAWMQMELTALARDNSTGRPTKAQREQAKEAVQERCAAEAATGKYRKMAHFPILWDLPHNLLYFGGSGAAAAGHCADLLTRAFGVEFSRLTAGTLATQWAHNANRMEQLADAKPVPFATQVHYSDLSWSNEYSDCPDYLGNEFLLWLWWHLENESDCIKLSDDSEVTVMLAKTLTLECPVGEHGKETITAEAPVKLSEAWQAVSSGKLPRKAGMTLVRHGQQFDLVLQAESFAISGAKIQSDDSRDRHDRVDRIDTVRTLAETVDLLFGAFCLCRLSSDWSNCRQSISNWLGASNPRLRQSAA
ncbi:MAG: hypothetical protein KDB22_17435 [Planctomycetales bacterium]|nr:hypothetical protein [Planctomycetales bacterium]